jgi:hypothetical protein
MRVWIFEELQHEAVAENFSLYLPELQISDILRLIRILGFVHCVTNPDPALFVRGF